MSKKMIGIIGGIGAHASALLYQKIIDMEHAVDDIDYPMLLIQNMGFKDFSVSARLTEIAAIELKNSINTMAKAGCEEVWTICNSVHVHKSKWWIDDLCVDWPKLFNESFPSDCIVLGSNETRNGLLYKTKRKTTDFENELIDECISRVISGSRAMLDNETLVLWNKLIHMMSGEKVIIACTDLSVLNNMFGFGGCKAYDALDFIAQQIFYSSKKEKRN